MDKKDIKLEKKLAKVATQIKKSRRDKDAVKKEEKQLNEIKQLLETSDDEEYLPDDKENSSEANIDILPLETPCIEVFQVGKIFSIFNEETLVCDAFLNLEEKPFIFGTDIREISEDGIRSLIQHGLVECIRPDIDVGKSVSLYVFYLLSVHSNLKFVKACFEFLKQRRCNLSSENVLIVLANFGSSIQTLCDSKFEIDFPFQCQTVKCGKKKRFPLANMRMVIHLLLYYVKNKLIAFDWHTKDLLRALSKITLDPYVRSSGLCTDFSKLLSILAAQAVSVYGSYEVTTWLRLNDCSFLEQIENCTTVAPNSQELQHELVLVIIDDLLKPKKSFVTSVVKVKDLKRILEELKRKPFDIMQYYCVCQLLSFLLPFVDITVKESQELNLLLGSLEGKVVNKKDSTDILRIKLEIAKLQNWVTCKTDNLQAVNECMESPVKGVRGHV